MRNITLNFLMDSVTAVVTRNSCCTVVCVSMYTLINLELAEFKNYRIRDYSHSGHGIYCSLLECERAISWKSVPN